MKVLAVIDSLRVGGAENLIATLARAAPHAGFELEVASLAPPPADSILPLFEAAGLEPRFLSITRLADVRGVSRLAATIRASGCDVVHAHLEYAAILAPPAARLAGHHAVCTFHHVPHPLPRREAVKERLAVAMATRSRAVVFVSRASMEAFAARYRPNPKTWAVVHNGVDLSRFRAEPATFPVDVPVPPGAPVATIVASMGPGKGHRQAIAAWPSVAARVTGARLLLVGSGPEERALRRLAAALGVGHLVVFVGIRADVPQLMRASTLVLLPSESEALPTTLIEAAACGRAVVAVGVGGVPEVVTHGRTGLLVSPGDRVGLADAVVGLLTDEERRDAMGRAGRRLAEERFDMHAWARRLRSVYERVLSGRPPAAAGRG
jgi:glycosyltransferase involved in cell wall biosynthesis